MQADRRATGPNFAKEEAASAMLEALKEVIEVLRIHAPGTPLNNHRFDALGIKAHAAIAAAEAAGITTPALRASQEG